MLLPLPYHEKVQKHFKNQKKTWDYFTIRKTKEDQLQQFKIELLKNTYKFDPQIEIGLYEKINIVKHKLSLEQLPVTVYQAQNTDELNASIVYINSEAHIVFSGPVIKLLSEQELFAVLAHELTHIKLYTMLDGDLEVADRILTAISNNPTSDPPYFEAARLFRLYTEIFCDRGACLVTEDASAVITSLVKVSTGLESVNAESYLKQAEEIFTFDGEIKASTITHPENFIRARAAKLWLDKNEKADELIASMIEGMSTIDQLDIFMQKELSSLTRNLLQLFLKPKWFQSTLALSLAKQYFPDFPLDENIRLDEKFINKMNRLHSSVKDYLSYTLLDFVLLDSSLEEIPFGWGFQFAEDIGLKEQFDSALKKELKLSDKKLKQKKEKSLGAFHEVKENESEQIYE